jgi:hypothetical protein
MLLTVTKQDQEESGPYMDAKNCLVSTMLKRAGYKNVNAYGYEVNTLQGNFNIDGIKVYDLYEDSDDADISLPLLQKVSKKAIGQKIEFRKKWL